MIGSSQMILNQVKNCFLIEAAPRNHYAARIRKIRAHIFFQDREFHLQETGAYYDNYRPFEVNEFPFQCVQKYHLKSDIEEVTILRFSVFRPPLDRCFVGYQVQSPRRVDVRGRYE